MVCPCFLAIKGRRGAEQLAANGGKMCAGTFFMEKPIRLFHLKQFLDHPLRAIYAFYGPFFKKSDLDKGGENKKQNFQLDYNGKED